MFRCEGCGGEVKSPGTAFVRVTGWGKPNSKGVVKELFGAGAPHGFMCDDCAFDMKNKPDKTEKLF